MIAFSGVRSSWLTFARNTLLVRLARSALSRASTSASEVRSSSRSACRDSVVSRNTNTAPAPAPFTSSGVSTHATGRTSPPSRSTDRS
jgi:hypothetical protein